MGMDKTYYEIRSQRAAINTIGADCGSVMIFLIWARSKFIHAGVF